jgi:serine phosphatase RsbU (regulator of sigma subunit)
MDQKSLKKFQETLSTHRDLILEWLNQDSHHQKTHLAARSTEDVAHLLSELKTALDKIEDKKFGKCEVCDGDIEEERLELDYTTSVCLDHFSEKQIRALEEDMELAGRVQRQLLPCCFPEIPELEIAAHTQSAGIVGGDYYDFFINKDGCQGLAIADVMGKGFPASLLMANLQASLRILGPEYRTPGEIVSRLNDLFRNNLKLIRFISLFLGIIDIENQTLKYCNSGHHPPILWNELSGKIMLLQPTAPAIGLITNGRFKSGVIPYHSGDLLLLYTDGVIEARNAQ